LIPQITYLTVIEGGGGHGGEEGHKALVLGLRDFFLYVLHLITHVVGSHAGLLQDTREALVLFVRLHQLNPRLVVLGEETDGAFLGVEVVGGVAGVSQRHERTGGFVDVVRQISNEIEFQFSFVSI
jgi:hypothetical protein